MVEEREQIKKALVTLRTRQIDALTQGQDERALDLFVQELYQIIMPSEQLEAAKREAEIEVWRYLAQTPAEREEIINFDKDPSGNTVDIEYHYSPPKQYVDEKIKQLARPEAKGESK